MKILIINTVPTDKNGITNVIFNYLRNINTEGLTFDYVSLNKPEQMYEDFVENKGGRMYVIPRLEGTIAYWNGLRKLIRTNCYDAVHIHGNSRTVVLELSAAWAAGCKVRIVHAHSTQTSNPLIHKLTNPVFTALTTHGLACGINAGLFMFGNSKYSVLNNGVDTNLYAFNQQKRVRLRADMNWGQCKVIGHVGYFLALKNHKWIIEVFKELHKRDNAFRLLLIGDGELRTEIEEKLSASGLSDAVTMTGNINNVNEYLNAMDLILMPSLFEGLPLTLIEQQANGLRCVVSDTITREADKTDSLTFLPLDAPVSDWADTIENILTSEKVDRYERSMSNIAKIERCGYSIQEEARKLQAYYLNAIKKS